MSNVKSKKNKLIVFLFCTVIIFLLGNNLRKSLFFRRIDRINLVVYDKYPVFYSLGIKDKTDYKIVFYPDLKVTVPGGYDRYRIGALGKLVSLEKKPDIFKKTFSSATFSFVDYYFYPTSSEVYYGQRQNVLSGSKWSIIFFSKSNARFFDRLFLIFNCYFKRNSDFIELSLVDEKNNNKDMTLMTSDTLKSLLGYLYKISYRDEKFNVQLIYSNSYATANLIAQIIEGNGIRVVDISQKELNDNESCELITQIDQSSQTVKDLKDFFYCRLTKRKADVSDIVLKLGSLEKNWEVQ